MHPKQIIKSVEGLVAKIVLEEDDLYIQNPIQVYPELEHFIQSYKKRIIDYLNGRYNDKDHAIKQTIDKTINFYLCVEQDSNGKIGDWLNHDKEAADMVMELVVLFSNNGWFPFDPVANYETVETDELSKKIYERSMRYFKKGGNT